MALPILQLGIESPLVIQVRNRLAALGFPINIQTTMPHVYDSAVQATVSAFQQSVGLAADGVVGPSTWAKLGADPTAGDDVAKAGLGTLGTIFLAAVAYFGYRKIQKMGGFKAAFIGFKQLVSSGQPPLDGADGDGDDDDYDEFGADDDDDDDENLLSPAETEWAEKERRKREIEKKVEKRVAARVRAEKKAGYRAPSEPTSGAQREIFRKWKEGLTGRSTNYPEGTVWNYEADRAQQAARKDALLMAHRERQEERAEKTERAPAGEAYYPGLVGKTMMFRPLPGAPETSRRVAVLPSQGPVWVGSERDPVLPSFTPASAEDNRDLTAMRQPTHDHLIRVRKLAESGNLAQRCQAKGIVDNWVASIVSGQLAIEDEGLVRTMLAVAEVVAEDTENDNCPKPVWREREGAWQSALGPSTNPTETLLDEPVVLAWQGKCEEAARVLVKRRVFGTNISTPKDQRLFKRAIRVVGEYCPWELEAEVLREQMHEENWFPSEQGEQPSPLLKGHLRINRRAKADPAHDYDRDTLTALLRAQPDVGRGQRVLEKGIITSKSPQRLVPHVSASAGGRIVYIDNQGDEVVGQTVGASRSEDPTITVEDSTGKKSVIFKERILRFLPKFGPLIASRPASERKISPEQRAADNALKKLRRAEKKAADDAKKQAEKIAAHQLMRAQQAAAERLRLQTIKAAGSDPNEIRSTTTTRVRPDGDLDWYAADY